MVIVVSQHHAASGEPFYIERETFLRIWRRLEDGADLSREDEGSYTSLPAILDGDYRASGVMSALNTVIDEVESDVDPVRVWLRS